MLKMLKATILATIALVTFGAGSSNAFTLGSFARNQTPVIAGEMTSLAYPALCTDVACGQSTGKASDFQPLYRAAYAAIDYWTIAMDIKVRDILTLQ